MFTIALSALSLLPLALAAPTPQSGSVTFPPPPPGTKFFKLRAVVPGPYKNKDCHSDFNNTYAITYHTGAGFNDVTFQGNETEASLAFFNTTSNQLMVAPNSADSGSDYAPYTFANSYGSMDSYQNFDTVTANSGYGDADNMGAYFANATGIQYNSAGTAANAMANITTDNQFEGWLVCDWWHDNVPQLFWSFEEGYPKNCERVLLIEC